MTDKTSTQIVGENIRSFREKMGLTQDALADFLGISREQISYYETAQRSVPSAQITKLANLFCIDEYDLFENDFHARGVNVAFAFRADELNAADLRSIAQFKKVVRNYINMKKFVCDE